MKKTISINLTILLLLFFSYPSFAYMDLGDGTILAGQKMWQKSDDSIMRNLSEAINYCDNLSLAGYSNWRLPFGSELSNILQRSTPPPCIDPIFDCHSYHYWSKYDYPDSNWVSGVNFGIDYGNGPCYSWIDFFENSPNRYYVRCIRDIATFTLSVSKNGNGTITSSPPGINCGGDCTEDYLSGTLVTLAVTPDTGWNFTGWSGNCFGTGACQVTMDFNKSVTATFITFPGTVQLPKTGQTTCYDETGNVIDCIGTGQDGEIQSGIEWSNPRFTDNSDGTITDNLTGLMWLKDANCAETIGYNPDSSPNSQMSWLNALDFIQRINNGTFSNCSAGYSDWSLPNVNEFESLVNNGVSNISTWLIEQGFNNIATNDMYWTSTTDASDTNRAWMKTMWSSEMWPSDKTTGRYVLPVRFISSSSTSPWKTGQTVSYASGDDGDLKRGVAWPNPRFTDNSDGTITDNLTGLMWLKDVNCIMTNYSTYDNDQTIGDGRVTWQHGLDFIEGVNNGTYTDCNAGYTDWYLPNRKEMHSVTDFSQYNPAIQINHPFINIPQDYEGLWTSTSEVPSPSQAFSKYLSLGWIGGSPKATYYKYVWPVREGIANPVPYIKANGSDSPVLLTQGDNLTVGISLDSGEYDGDNADWWILLFYYNPITSIWTPVPLASFQQPLIDFSGTLFNTTGLPPGQFVFFFGVDMILNGTMDMGEMYYDYVAVNINPLSGSPVLTLIPSSLPDGTKDTFYSQNVTMIVDEGSPPYTYSCSGSGVAGITATVNSNTCLISGIPSGTGTYLVTYRVDDNAGKFDIENRSFTVIAVEPGDPPGVVEVYNHDTLNRVSISPGGTNYYKFTITPDQSGMQVALSTFDWITNQDMMISLGSPYPTTNDYPVGSSFNANGDYINGSQKWAKIIAGSSNETLYIFTLQAGTYYVMIHNTSIIEGEYGFGLNVW